MEDADFDVELFNICTQLRELNLKLNHHKNYQAFKENRPKFRFSPLKSSRSFTNPHTGSPHCFVCHSSSNLVIHHFRYAGEKSYRDFYRRPNDTFGKIQYQLYMSKQIKNSGAFSYTTLCQSHNSEMEKYINGFYKDSNLLTEFSEKKSEFLDSISKTCNDSILAGIFLESELMARKLLMICFSIVGRYPSTVKNLKMKKLWNLYKEFRYLDLGYW